MDDDNMKKKSVEQRLKEAMEVRERLAKCGVLLNPDLREKFTQKSNAFVRDGKSSAFWLQDELSNIRARVSLNAVLESQSGVVMEMD